MTKVVAKFRHRDVEKPLQTLSAKKERRKGGRSSRQCLYLGELVATTNKWIVVVPIFWRICSPFNNANW